jgi:hypothetical protein
MLATSLKGSGIYPFFTILQTRLNFEVIQGMKRCTTDPENQKQNSIHDSSSLFDSDR